MRTYKFQRFFVHSRDTVPVQKQNMTNDITSNKVLPKNICYRAGSPVNLLDFVQCNCFCLTLADDLLHVHPEGLAKVIVLLYTL